MATRYGIATAMLTGLVFIGALVADEDFSNRRKSPQAATMTITDVVALTTSGVSDDVILNQMRTTGATFTLSTDDIIVLKKYKVSDRVVIELQNSRLAQQAAVVPAAALTAPIPASFNPVSLPHWPTQPWVCPASFNNMAPPSSLTNRTAAEFIQFCQTTAADLRDRIYCTFFGAYDSDPNGRMRQILNQSDDLREVQKEWDRWWFTNPPSNLSYDRLSGSIGP